MARILLTPKSPEILPRGGAGVQIGRPGRYLRNPKLKRRGRMLVEELLPHDARFPILGVHPHSLGGLEKERMGERKRAAWPSLLLELTSVALVRFLPS